MASDPWTDTTLGALCDEGGLIQTGPFGSQLHAEDYTDSGVPVVMPTNIGDNLIDPEDIARTSESNAERLSRHRLQPYDIVYPRRGEIRKRALVRPSQEGWLCGTGCLLVRPPEKTCDARWLSYWLGAPWTAQWLIQHAVGATMPNLNTQVLADVPVSLPPLTVQRRIAAVLGALDDLIETNQRLILSAGDLWRSLVRRSCAADSEARPLSAIAEFINGRNFTKGATGSGRPVIRTPEVRSGPTASTVRSAVDASEDHVARSGDVLFVWSGSLTVNRWAWEDGLINQHVFKVGPTTGIPEWLVMAAIESQMPWFRSLAADKATTMGHIQRRHLDEVALVPAGQNWPDLDAAVRPLWDLEISLAQESDEVRRTRDELLPLLLSGRVSPGEVVLGV